MTDNTFNIFFMTETDRQRRVDQMKKLGKKPNSEKQKEAVREALRKRRAQEKLNKLRTQQKEGSENDRPSSEPSI